MQNETDSFYQYNEFLHILVFSKLFQKTDGASLAFEVLNRKSKYIWKITLNFSFKIIHLIKYITNFSSNFQFFIQFIQTHVFIRNC